MLKFVSFKPKFWLLVYSFTYYVSTANGSVPLDYFIPYGRQNGDSDLRPVNLDDGSSEQLNISVGFPFFDHMHDSLWVNINGVISLRNALWTYTPICDAVPHDFRMIAPFWTDIDLRQNGNVFYRETLSASVLEKASNEVKTAFPEFADISLRWAFVTTWFNVPYFGANATTAAQITNTFQSVLVSNGIYSFAIFYYNDLMWAGSNPAKSGFDAGDGELLYMIDGSCTNHILTINERSNVGTPGVWVFRVDNSDIESPGCNADFKGNAKVVPAFIDLFGNVPIHITGPCFNNTIDVLCRFHDTIKGPVEVSGQIVESDVEPSVVCVAPFLYSTGRINIEVVANFKNNETKVYPGIIYVIPPQEDSDYRVDIVVNESQTNFVEITFRWNVNHFLETDTLDIKLYTYDSTAIDWQFNKTFSTNDPNTGTSTTTFPKNYFEEKVFRTAFIFSIEPHHQYSDSNLTNPFRNAEKIFTRFNKLYALYKIIRNVKVESCAVWHHYDAGPKKDLPACPPTAALAERDNSYESDPQCTSSQSCFFQYGADFCIRSRTPSNSGGGQQCCYKGGNILIGPPGGGTADNHYHKGYYGHFVDDVLPWILCCLDESEKLCGKYYEKRPSDPGTNYTPPIPAAGKGDPHITTFDHLEYTFNGYGEFWMIKNSDAMPMQLQARMEPFINADESSAAATVFTAFVMKSDNSSTVQVQRSEIRIVDVYVDGIAEELSNHLLYDMNYNGVQVSVALDRSSVTVSFDSGFNFHIITNSEAFSIITTCDEKYRNKTSGLLGVFDGNQDNDLQDPSGHAIEINSTLHDIHYNFGLEWNIQESESLFTYIHGKHYADYNKLTFIPNFQTPDLESASQEAKDICGDSVNCLYDYITTRSATVANLTKTFEEQFNETVEIFHTPVIQCPQLFSPSNGDLKTGNFLAGSVATYSCDENYVLDGESSNVCTDTGVWNTTSPTCQPIHAPTDAHAVDTTTVVTTLQTTIIPTVAPTVASTVASTVVITTAKHNENIETTTGTANKTIDENTTKTPNSGALDNHLNYIIMIIAIFIKFYFI